MIDAGSIANSPASEGVSDQGLAHAVHALFLQMTAELPRLRTRHVSEDLIQPAN